MAFPSSLDSLIITVGATEVLGTAGSGLGLAAILNNANTAINSLETKIGIDSSAVVTSIDYLLKNTASTDPGHKHTVASISGTLPVANGGTGAATLTGVLIGNGTSAFTTVTAPTGTILGTTDTQTLTNKRITKRTGTITSSATPTINTDNVDIYLITAQAVDITSFTTNLSGTPTEGQTLWIAITGTAARAITWGASFEASTIALPTTTVSTNRLDVGFVWNTVTSKWRCVASV